MVSMNYLNKDKNIMSFSLWFMIFAAFLLGFRSTIGQSYLGDGSYLKFLTYLVWGFVFFSICLNTYSLTHVFIAMTLLLVCFIVWRSCKNNTAFFNSVIIIASRKLNIRKILKANCLGILMACLLVVFCEEIGIIPERIMFEEGIKIRSLGFRNPNTLPNCFNMIIYLYTYTNYNHIKYRHLILINIIAVSLYCLSHCRTGFILSLLLTIVVFLYKISTFFRDWTIKLSLFAALSIAFVAVFGMIFIKIFPIFMEINDVLSGCLVQPAWYFVKYGVHPFGVFIEELQSQNKDFHYLIDNGYALVLINFGLVYFCIFYGAYWKTLKMKTKEKDYKAIIALLFMLLNMVAETNPCSFLYNWLIILCVDVVFPCKNNRTRKVKMLHYLTVFSR